MAEPHDLETLLSPLRASFHARRREVVALCDDLEQILSSYRQAVDNAILRDLAQSHGLPSPAPTHDARRLALELLDKIQRLPELRGLLVLDESRTANPATSDTPGQPNGIAVIPGQARPPIRWPRLAEALRNHPLVIVGGSPHLERLKGLGLEPELPIEWVDTTRKGTHAIGNLEHRIKDRRVAGLVLLEGLVQHRHTDPLVSTARHAEVPVAYAGKGGRASIGQALETLEKMLSPKT